MSGVHGDSLECQLRDLVHRLFDLSTCEAWFGQQLGNSQPYPGCYGFFGLKEGICVMASLVFPANDLTWISVDVSHTLDHGEIKFSFLE